MKQEARPGRETFKAGLGAGAGAKGLGDFQCSGTGSGLNWMLDVFARYDMKEVPGVWAGGVTVERSES